MAHAAGCRRESRLEVADVFRAFGEAYRAAHVLSRRQARVFEAILACRTAVLGGHLDCCRECGFERPSYNSCFDRHCPKCQGPAAGRWVEARKKNILPVAYFHLVFTLPAELRPLALRNRKAIFHLLFQAAASTLLTLGADPDRLGALLGITAVLHTWTRDLCFHPHLHCIVTGGGLLGDGRWVGVGGRYLFPVAVMGRLFRGRFLAGLERLWQRGALDLGGSCSHLADPDAFGLLLDELYRKPWRPYVKRPFAGPGQVYDYLGYYTHRVGIANHRLLEMDGDSVHFKTKGGKTARLKGVEFVRRFLLHVLPRGFVKIRHYGLLGARAAARRQAVRDALSAVPEPPPGDTEATCQATGDERPESWQLDLVRCPRCGEPAMVRRAFRERAPPGHTERTP